MARSKQGQTMTMHTYTPLTNVSTKKRDTGRTNFFPPHHHHYHHPDTMGENNTPTALKGCGVIKINWQLKILNIN